MNVNFPLVLLIIAINITYVSLTTLRMILVVKGLRRQASLLAMVEVFVYISGLSVILQNLGSVWNIVAYCVGYGIGVISGSKIEEKMALGYIAATVVVDSHESELPEFLRGHKFGVTAWLGEGKDGQRLMMLVLAKRNRQWELQKLIDSHSPHAFTFFEEPKNFRGGFWSKKL